MGHALVEEDGGQVILIDLVPGFSTTRIVRQSRAPDRISAGRPRGEWLYE